MTNETHWNLNDVEQVAQATMQDQIAPPEILERLGPFPPKDYLIALGRRVYDLTQEQQS